jgi:hypothetical protein
MAIGLFLLLQPPSAGPSPGPEVEQTFVVRLIRTRPRTEPVESKPRQIPVRPAITAPADPGSAEVAGASAATSVRSAPAPQRAPPFQVRLPVLAPPPLGLDRGAPARTQGDDTLARRDAFSARGRLERKARALEGYGGGGTEGAVERGLRWLAAHQNGDGSWSAQAFQRHCSEYVPCAGRGLAEFDAGVTGLATLAFLGAGYTPDPVAPSTFASAANGVASHGSAVYRALEFLLRAQDTNGTLGRRGDHFLYNHAIAALALVEAFSLTEEPRYRHAAQTAMDFIVNAQQARGGWDYTEEATGRNDLSVTGWQIMALRAATHCGILVPEESFLKATRFLREAVTSGGDGIYADQGQEAGRRGINMVAVGLLTKLYLGAKVREIGVQRAVEKLLRAPPEWKLAQDWEKTYQSYYYWYTATLALFHHGGKPWDAWNFFLKRTLLPLQSTEGHTLGSWPPEASWIGMSGGRVYSTATAVLTLETYYRYVPLVVLRKSVR